MIESVKKSMSIFVDALDIIVCVTTTFIRWIINKWIISSSVFNLCLIFEISMHGVEIKNNFVKSPKIISL